MLRCSCEKVGGMNVILIYFIIKNTENNILNHFNPNFIEYRYYGVYTPHITNQKHNN